MCTVSLHKFWIGETWDSLELKKALYGLRTSPRAWEERDRKLSNLTLDNLVGKVGLKSADTTLVSGQFGNWTWLEIPHLWGMLIAYVDDLIAVGDQS